MHPNPKHQETLLAQIDKPRPPGSHSVHFYETEHHLVQSLTAFFSEGLQSGAPCVVIATAAHRQTLESRLLSAGIPVSVARSQGRFIELDAAETLGKFMADGMPDAALFREAVGPWLRRRGRPTLRAFGEMVALLWAEGNRDAALRLEQLWNEAARQYSFNLLCAYPRAVFAHDSTQADIERVCRCHTQVITD